MGSMSTLNLNPTKQGTYIQAPTNENNNLNIGNDNIKIGANQNNITLDNEKISLEANQSQVGMTSQELTIQAPQVKISANSPINLNGASLTQAFSSILQALNQINIALQTIKYMPGSMSVPPITIDSQAITNSNGKIE